MKKCMAANWKMYKLQNDAEETARALVRKLKDKLPSDREVVVFPPFTALSAVYKAFHGQRGFSLGAQNFYPDLQGAYTGEIAPEMLKDLGCSYALAGHSERRHIFEEDNAFISRKFSFGLQNHVNMVLCIGETLKERKHDMLQEVLKQQLAACLNKFPKEIYPSKLCIAYEPVWAIGTGEVAGNQDIVRAHNLVRKILLSYFPEAGSQIRILYGGSVKPDNCAQIIELDNVDGVLVGGAGLSADSFSEIVLAAT